MSETSASNYWLTLAAKDIVAQYPTGEIVISSGISPSASYHIGHFREILTADALTWAVRRAGRKAQHVHVVDNFDPLRDKPNPAWPSDWDYKRYVGQPICLIPDPFEACREQHGSYAEHFYREFEGHALHMGIVPDEVVRSYEDLYATGRMTASIEQAVDHAALIRDILAAKSNRRLSEDWLPLQLLGPDKSFAELMYKSIDTGNQIIVATNSQGDQVRLNYAAGEVKLNWRLDWPARWQVLGVQVEPFSAQEHGAAGSSYDTGVEFSRQVFGYEPPIPGVQYANIHMLGDTKKMSSSRGNLITPGQALEIMPAEILRYFVVRSRPDRTLYWDSGEGLYRLIDEFSQVQEALAEGQPAEFADAYRFATAGRADKVITRVPFNHLVMVYQTAQGDLEAIWQALRRDGWELDAKERPVLEREVGFVANWLGKFAPDSVKFSLQSKLPRVELSSEQERFLDVLAEDLASGSLNGQGMHDLIYAAVQKAEVRPGQAFQAIYRLVLGQDSGPKAGWFLASLDHDWLVKRLRRQA